MGDCPPKGHDLIVWVFEEVHEVLKARLGSPSFLYSSLQRERYVSVWRSKELFQRATYEVRFQGVNGVPSDRYQSYHQQAEIHPGRRNWRLPYRTQPLPGLYCLGHTTSSIVARSLRDKALHDLESLALQESAGCRRPDSRGTAAAAAAVVGESMKIQDNAVGGD